MMVILDLAKKNHDPKFKMAVMPICGRKTFKRLLLQIWLTVCMKHMGLLPIQDVAKKVIIKNPKAVMPINDKE